MKKYIICIIILTIFFVACAIVVPIMQYFFYKFKRGIFMNKNRFSGDGYIYDDNDNMVSPLDDDYKYWKFEQERLTDPLSDDYDKYANE